MRYVTPLALFLAAPFAALAGPPPSWNPTATEDAILGFVNRVTDPGSADFVSARDPIAVFDGDGTLRSVRPMHFQGLFALDRPREQARADPSILTSDAPRAATAGDGPRFGMIVHHTDAAREVAYDRDGAFGGLSEALDAAPERGWTVFDMAADRRRVWTGAE